MDKRKSSRIHDMKYSYRIITINQSVIEYINDFSSFIWDVKLLANNEEKIKIESKIESKSFNRTKKWLQENHPELLI